MPEIFLSKENEFETVSLKKLNLTADTEKDNLPKVLTTIANTFDISYRMNGKKLSGSINGRRLKAKINRTIIYSHFT